MSLFFIQCFLALNQAALLLLGLIAAFLQLAVGFDALLDFVLWPRYGFAFLVSPALIASLMMRVASVSAEPISFSATLLRYRN